LLANETGSLKHSLNGTDYDSALVIETAIDYELEWAIATDSG
jgi:hypothetical protein